jgi:hypothetical protein
MEEPTDDKVEEVVEVYIISNYVDFVIHRYSYQLMDIDKQIRLFLEREF